MDSKICFEMIFFVVEAIGPTWPMCEFHDYNCNGFGDMCWTDKCIYFSSIEGMLSRLRWYDTSFDRNLKPWVSSTPKWHRAPCNRRNGAVWITSMSSKCNMRRQVESAESAVQQVSTNCSYIAYPVIYFVQGKAPRNHTPYVGNMEKPITSSAVSPQ